MRVNWNYIKLAFLSVSVVALYGFADHRSKQKKVSEVTIKFMGEDNLYLTEDAGNKLLIQNYGPLKNRGKEQLVLNTIWVLVLSNNMVKSDHVYLTVNGGLISKIVQRKPIGRVEGISKFYLDDLGKRMPL